MDLPALKRLRGALKGAITRSLADLDEFLDTAVPVDIIGKKEAIERNLKKIVSYDDQIIQKISNDADLERELDESLNYVAGIEANLAQMHSTLDHHKVCSATNSIKLPQLQLPVFGGEATEWNKFWDLFKSAVHDRNDISPIQKFTYLKGQLVDQAKTLVDGINLESGNYAVCVDLLKSTYGRVDVVKASHVQALINLHTPGCSLADLTEFRSSFECHLRSLNNLNLTLDEFYCILLIDKLPAQFKEVVRRAAGDQWLNLDKFREVYRDELHNIQDSAIEPKGLKYATASFVVQNEGEVRVRCKLCKSDHPWYKCTVYPVAEDKLIQLRKLKLCLACAGNHFVKNCKAVKKPCHNCGAKHYYQLCKSPKENPKSDSSATAKSVLVVSQNNQSSRRKMTSVLSTVNIPLMGTRKGSVLSRAFLDQGSQVSFVNRNLLKNVKYEKLGDETLRLMIYHHQEQDKRYELVRLYFRYRGEVYTIDCFVDDDLPLSSCYDGLSRHVAKFEAQGLNLADNYLSNKSEKLDLLIGLDNYYNIVHPGFKRRGNLVLLPTKFGYALSGKYDSKTAPNQVNTVSVLRVATTTMDRYKEADPEPTRDDLTQFWELEHIGIKHKEIDQDSIIALQHFDENVEYLENCQQYVVRLPWKKSPDLLPSNYGLALGRLQNLQKRFIKDEVFCENYSKVIAEQERKGYIERVSSLKTDRPCHYLSHHGVLKDSATTPIRSVFDCSAKSSPNSYSLNDLLYTGPSLVTELGKVLLRLRLGNYVALGDIEKAFLMVKLHPDDRDVTRFLWFEKPDDPNSKVIVFRFTAVLFGATCSQFLLNATILKHLSGYRECDYIKRGLYIDNLQITADQESQLLQCYWKAQRIFSSAHLFLREWITNSDTLLDQLQFDGVAAEMQDKTKVLGLTWWPSRDELGYHSNFQQIVFENDSVPSKRRVLSIIASVFDPLGLLLPVSIKARIFMQKLWKQQINWDDPITDILKTEWLKLVDDLKESMGIKFPRKVLDLKVSSCSLHVFSDASSLAYGAAGYILSDGVTHILMAKARVAPIKGLTIPKMELTSVLIAARLITYILHAYSQELHFDKIVLWTDSQIALHWLHSRNVLPVFVQNRVNEIRLLVPNVELRYVPTNENPADLLTRGLSAALLIDSELWWRGPSWLPFVDLWPQWTVDLNLHVPDDSSQVTLVRSVPEYTAFLQWDRHSTYERLRRVICWVLRFISNVRCNTTGDISRFDSILKLSELKQAEIVILSLVQLEVYDKELLFLRDGIGDSTPLINDLNLFYDENDGLLHCRGRLKLATMEECVKYPILLPRKHYVTRLIIERSHRLGMHYGVNYVVTLVRQHYWIPHMRQTVKAVLHHCRVCKRWRNKAYPPITSPDLPKFRVTKSEPFDVTGVDYTGAITIKSKPNAHRKVYIVLFTCATTRAVHIDIAEDLTQHSFLNVFKRFCGRRSLPKLMLSDNATYFVATANFLGEVMKDEVLNYLRDRGCRWHFIPARAPWFGAIWERCIGTLKRGLHKCLSRALVSFDELHTLLVEIEGIINDRPLTYSSGELQEPEALTPSHLLSGHKLRPYPILVNQNDNLLMDPDFVLRQSSVTAIQQRYRFLSTLINHFWSRWSREYLTMLKTSHKSATNMDGSWPTVGEVVLISDDGPRLHWKMGLITKLFPGNDGRVRVVQLKTPTGLTTRPVVKLYPLELHADESVTKQNSVISSDRIVNQAPSRPTRLTAQAARQVWRDRLNAGQL